MSCDDENLFFGRADEGHFLELQWDTSWGAYSCNHNGTSGWARILRSSGDAKLEGCMRRIHKCACDPCNARWPASKYGPMGVPIHVQPVNKAEAVFGPQPPGSAPLTAGEIPLPATLDPQLRAAAFSEFLSPVSQDPQLRGPTSGPTSPGVGPGDREHAKARIYDRIFHLAREIASARAYVGYVFFCDIGFDEEMQTVHVGGKFTSELGRNLCTMGAGLRSGGLCCGWCRMLHEVAPKRNSRDGARFR